MHFVIHSGDKTEVSILNEKNRIDFDKSGFHCVLDFLGIFRFVENVVRVSIEKIIYASIQNLIRQNGSKKR